MAESLTQTFDSTEYTFADIEVRIGGISVSNIQKLAYKVSQKKEVVYGKGINPIAVQRGQKSYDGSIDMLQSEFESLIAMAPNHDILDLHFDILITYGNPERGDVLITDVLQGCEFTEAQHSIGNDEMYMKVSLPIIFLNLVSQK
jgi:hypothetical protein